MVRYDAVGQCTGRRLVADWLAPPEPATVLDVGCGPGHMINRMRMALPAARFMRPRQCGRDRWRRTAPELPWARWDGARHHPRPARTSAASAGGAAPRCSSTAPTTKTAARQPGRHDRDRWLKLAVPTGRLCPLEAGFGDLTPLLGWTSCAAAIERPRTARGARAGVGLRVHDSFQARGTSRRPQATLRSAAASAPAELARRKPAVAALTGLFVAVDGRHRTVTSSRCPRRAPSC